MFFARFDLSCAICQWSSVCASLLVRRAPEITELQNAIFFFSWKPSAPHANAIRFCKNCHRLGGAATAQGASINFPSGSTNSIISSSSCSSIISSSSTSRSSSIIIIIISIIIIIIISSSSINISSSSSSFCSRYGRSNIDASIGNENSSVLATKTAAAAAAAAAAVAANRDEMSDSQSARLFKLLN